jgi:hypothetical protein
MIQANDQNFIFAARIKQDNYVESPHITFSLNWKRKVNSTNNASERINLRPCSKEDFEKLYFSNAAMIKDVSLYDIGDWVCPEFGTQGIELGGRYNSEIFDYVKLTATFCNQANSNNDWKYICPTTS